HLLGGRLVLVENPHLNIARRLVGEILLAVDGSARNVIAVADLQHLRRLALDGESDFALLNRRPLVAGMAVELVACARRHGHGLHPYLARRIFLQWHREIALVLERRRCRLRPCRRLGHGSCHEDYWKDQLVHEPLPWATFEQLLLSEAPYIVCMALGRVQMRPVISLRGVDTFGV